jgi:hypothetical protein
MKSKLIFSIFLSLFCTGLFASQFVEAQLKYAKSNPNFFQYSWDGPSQTAQFDMKLEWHNFNQQWHKGGFSIVSAKKAYISFPDLPFGCHLIDYDGQIIDSLKAEHSLSLTLKGESCQGIVDTFKLLDVTISFYGVYDLAQVEQTQVLQIVIYDAV